jgi:hypothetical protein
MLILELADVFGLVCHVCLCIYKTDWCFCKLVVKMIQTIDEEERSLDITSERMEAPKGPPAFTGFGSKLSSYSCCITALICRALSQGDMHAYRPLQITTDADKYVIIDH